MSDVKGETTLDLHNRVTGEELEKLLKMQLDALAEDPEMARALPPLMVWGAPGLGKSSILRDVARERGSAELAEGAAAGGRRGGHERQHDQRPAAVLLGAGVASGHLRRLRTDGHPVRQQGSEREAV